MSKTILIFTLLLTSLLTGCTSWQNSTPAPSTTAQDAGLGAVGGAVLGGVAAGSTGAVLGGVSGGILGGIIGHKLSKNQSLVAKLEADDVKVIQVGDDLTIVLPSDRFFSAGTPLPNKKYNKVLDEVIVLLNNFEKFDVLVAGYTDSTGWPDKNLAVSRQQALGVSMYLWKHGLDARVLSPVGYGSAHPIASNQTVVGRALNRRIEITMRLLHEPDDM